MTHLAVTLIGCYIGVSLLIALGATCGVSIAAADPRHEMHTTAVRILAGCHGPVGVFLVVALTWPVPWGLPQKRAEPRHRKVKR